MINKYIQQLTRAWQGLSKPQLRVKKNRLHKVLSFISCFCFVLFFVALALSLSLSGESFRV